MSIETPVSGKKYSESTPYILDIHTHSLASGHAYGTIREMAQAASEKGLALLGITEHAPGTPGTCAPIYFLNLQAVPKTLYGVRVIHGSEINVLNDGTLSLNQRYIDRLDYAIAGIHGDCYQDAGRERNTRNLISCMRNEKVHFVSHPDDDHTPLDYEMLVAAAKECQVALVDVKTALSDENGILPADATVDGVHFTKAWYQKWLEYLMCHTVTPEAYQAAQEAAQ